MRSTLFRRAAKLLALAIAALPGAAAAQACGDTLTGSVTLAADLHCSTGWTAFDVGASGITINLNGKTLSGTSALTGININGADNVRIVGPGRIRGFWVGANVFRSPKLIVDNVDFEDVGAGVMLNRSYMSTVRRSGFYRIANSAVLIEDPLIGTSMDAGGNSIVDNDFGKVDIAVRTCGATAGGNRIENNTIAAAYTAGIHLTDHSSGNYVAGNRMHNVYGAGIRVDASRGNTVVGNSIGRTAVGVELPARRLGRCVADPGMGDDNGDHKVYDNRIVGSSAGFVVGNNPYDGKVFRVVFSGNVIDGASTGVLFDVNSLHNRVFGSTYIGVGTPVQDFGYDNIW